MPFCNLHNLFYFIFVFQCKFVCNIKIGPSTFSHKCGSKQKNHQCGLGLCSIETKYPDLALPKKINLRSDLKPKAVTNIDVDKQSNPEKLIGRKCNKCARPIKGHPLPKGQKCNLEPLPMIEKIQLEQELNKLEKAREINKTDEAKAKASERNKSEAALTKARARKKSDAALAKDREREKI